MWREILPNVLPPLVAEYGLRFCFVFLTIAALSFLGVGIQPPTADWGSMVRNNASLIQFAQFDLTEAQFNVLFALKFATENITQAELGKRLVVTRASITSVLDKLESKNLVKRVDVPNNRRIHHVVLTDEGHELIVKAEPVYREEIYHVLTDLSMDDCQQLITHLEQIRSRVETQAPASK